MSSLSPMPTEWPIIKKRICPAIRAPFEKNADLVLLYIAKRAETRPCPVCDELIPLRLMAVHLDLELQRVEEIIKAVGSSEVLYDQPEELQECVQQSHFAHLFILYDTLYCLLGLAAPHTTEVVAQPSRLANP